MKKTKVILVLALLLITGITALASSGTAVKVEAYIANNQIVYYGQGRRIITKEYPIISYNDHTYLSVREVARVFRKDIEWFQLDDGTIEIYIKQLPKEDWIVQSEELALELGKAVIKTHYSDDVSENSNYHVFGVATQAYNAEYMYAVTVNFRLPEGKSEDETYMFNNADVMILLNPQDGSMRFYKTPDGWVE